MSKSDHNTCNQSLHWQWEEAFDKFGFGDGDGVVETWQVESALTKAGYHVEFGSWGLHNLIIASIKKDGIEQIPESVQLGYDNPRHYLPRRIVRLLDKHFPSVAPYAM